MFPPIPPWSGTHPLVVHFPIVLFLVAPLFMGLAMILPRRGRAFAVSALLLLLMGTASAWVCFKSGQAARDVIPDDLATDAITNVLDRHEDLAYDCCLVFTAITAAYAVAVGLPLVIKKLAGAWYAVPVQALFIAAMLAANVLLANTAHKGGQVVHQYGVRATTFSAPQPSDPGK